VTAIAARQTRGLGYLDLLGTAVLAVGSGLAILVGSVMAVHRELPRSPSQFQGIRRTGGSSPEVP
jgi:hypothetical protein